MGPRRIWWPATAAASPAWCGAVAVEVGAQRRSRPGRGQASSAVDEGLARSSSSAPSVKSSSNWSTTRGPLDGRRAPRPGWAPGVIDRRRSPSRGTDARRRSTDDLPLPEAPTSATKGWACRRVVELGHDLLAAEEARPRPGGRTPPGRGRGTRCRRRRRAHARAPRRANTRSGARSPAQAVGAEVDQAVAPRAGGAATSSAVVRREEDLRRRRPRPRRRAAEVQRRAEVVAAAALGLAGVEADPDREVAGRPATSSAARRSLAVDGGRRRPRRGAGNTDTVESPSPIDLEEAAAVRSTASAMRSSWTDERPRPCAGDRCSHSDGRPSMSVRQNVSTPVGSDSPQPARRRSTSSPGGLGPPGGIGGEAQADGRLQLGGLVGIDALPGRPHAGRAARRSAT